MGVHSVDSCAVPELTGALVFESCDQVIDAMTLLVVDPARDSTINIVIQHVAIVCVGGCRVAANDGRWHWGRSDSDD